MYRVPSLLIPFLLIFAFLVPTKHASADIELGLRAWLKGDLKSAEEQFEATLQKSSPGYLYWAGIFYWNEERPTSDQEKGIRYLKEAAKSGVAPAMNSLGWWYSTHDTDEAIIWLERAVYAGHHTSVSFLCILQSSEETEQNEALLALAKDLEKVAKLGDAAAQYSFSKFLRTDVCGKTDNSESDRWLLHSAEEGFPPAMFSASILYQFGSDSVPADPSRSLEMLRKAANQGDMDAQARLASMYHVGAEDLGVEQDLELAAFWYEVIFAEINSGHLKTSSPHWAIFMASEGLEELTRELAPERLFAMRVSAQQWVESEVLELEGNGNQNK